VRLNPESISAFLARTLSVPSSKSRCRPTSGLGIDASLGTRGQVLIFSTPKHASVRNLLAHSETEQAPICANP
jgi:hypothetical protein